MPQATVVSRETNSICHTMSAEREASVQVGAGLDSAAKIPTFGYDETSERCGQSIPLSALRVARGFGHTFYLYELMRSHEIMNDFVEMAMTSNKDAQAWIDGFEAIRHKTALGPLQADLTTITDEEAVIECAITDAARQPFGLLHGGISVMLSESAASMHAAWLGDLTKTAPVGVDINATHLSSARDGHIRVTARLIRQTRAFVFHEVEVTHIEDEKLLCKVRITNYFRPHER